MPMADEFEVAPEDVHALIDEIDVGKIEKDADWNVEIWIPEYAEAVLGEEPFAGLEAQLAGLPGVERLAWEDREVFLARVAAGTDLDELKTHVVDVVRGAVVEAGHRLP
jgi:hypothetical protein